MMTTKKINLAPLYKHQLVLDEEIIKKHNVSYETTIKERILSLIVELGELANETRCFKYWSNKGPSEKKVVLDEYADGLHFLLSLGLALGYKKEEYEFLKQDKRLTEQFLDVYQSFIALNECFTLQNYEKAFKLYLDLGASIGFDNQDIIDGYEIKLSTNHQRQKNNY